MFDFLKPLFGGEPKRLSPATFRAARPKRSADVEVIEEGGRATLTVPLAAMPRRGLLKAVIRKSKLPQRRTFELDDVGLFVWARCDGRTSVDAIVRALSTRYKMPRVEAEASLGAFLESLAGRGLIDLTVTKK